MFIHNYNFKDFTTTYVKDHCAEASKMINFITPTTTPEEFSQKLPDQYPINAVNTYGLNVLGAAAEKGNANLIEYIIKLGGDLSSATDRGESSLHLACECEDETKGLSAAKILYESGVPVNIVKKLERNFKGKVEVCFLETPFEKALEKGCVKIAAMLFRLGGVVRMIRINPKVYATLEAAKKEFMTDQEKLFIFGSKLPDSTLNFLPNDVINNILSISAKFV